MPPTKATVSVSPNPVSWGSALTASVAAPTATWLRAEVFQGDTLVYAQYVKVAQPVLTIGPTPAADETQPGSGRVEAGYWAKSGAFKPVAVAKFEVVA